MLINLHSYYPHKVVIYKIEGKWYKKCKLKEPLKYVVYLENQ